ncbi:MAG: hypothetical protein IKP47_04335 [Ruminococcus sp.]|nr:hypothetical protein [Ruminococcus sp.]
MTNLVSKPFIRRFAAMLTALALLVAAMPALDLTAFAAGAPWEGSGTATDPWRIETPADLISMSNGEGDDASDGYLYDGKYFALMNDIDMTGVDFRPIGYGYVNNNSNSYPFSGTFCGCGYTIKNLTINWPDNNYVALFSNIDGGSVMDLNVNGSIK